MNAIQINELGEIIIPVGKLNLHCGKGDAHEYGGYLRITDNDGNELIYQDKEEWADDPEAVIGAIFGALKNLQ